jgi:hypothetical protein
LWGKALVIVVSKILRTPVHLLQPFTLMYYTCCFLHYFPPFCISEIQTYSKQNLEWYLLYFFCLWVYLDLDSLPFW